jgi:hypothetical protein
LSLTLMVQRLPARHVDHPPKRGSKKARPDTRRFQVSL